jgi:hypothetical protein
MENMKRFKRGDLFLYLIGFIIMLSLAGFYLKGEAAQGEEIDGRTAVISRDGNRIAELDLDTLEEPRYFKLEDGIQVTIVAEKGSIKFLEAECPDKICVKTGTLTKPGDQAVCMPSRTIVRILDN